jgi:hypothetical protein
MESETVTSPCIRAGQNECQYNENIIHPLQKYHMLMEKYFTITNTGITKFQYNTVMSLKKKLQLKKLFEVLFRMC